jgi:hypothetical protein
MQKADYSDVALKLGGDAVKLPRRRFCMCGRGRCRAAGRLAGRKGTSLRSDRLMVGYAADTDRHTCTER